MSHTQYDTDFYAWTQAQAAVTRAKEVAALDIDRLAEEVEDFGRAVRKGIGSQLERLLLHLLKWPYDRPPTHVVSGASISATPTGDC